MDTNREVAIRLIGGVRVVYRSHVVDPRVVGGRRCVEVLAYLAVNRHRDVPQEELAQVLWPDNRPQSWYAGLRGLLSRVRDTLEIAELPADTVRSRGGSVRLTLPTGAVTDLELARRLCARPDDDTAASVRNARAAVAILDEPILGDVSGRWADDVRADADELRRRALENDASGSLTLGDAERAVSSGERLLTLDPLQEAAYRIVMSGYLALGERGRALSVAARCRRVLVEQLGSAPSPETESLYLHILRSEADDPTTATTVPAVIAHSDDLIGRSAEIGTIADAVDRAARGSGQFVVLVGEAGSGKTTVAAAAMRRARDTGATVLFGRCSEEAVIPFEPFVEAVTDELDSLGASTAREWLRTNGSEILRLVPNAARRLGVTMPTHSEVDDRAAAMTAVLDWLTAPTRTGPTLLVIDDLHWASTATLAVIRYIVHASARSRLCVLATVRDEYTDRDDVRATLAPPTRSAGVHRVALSGFTPAEVGALVEAAGTDQDPATLYERTNGLPLFVVSLIAAHQLGDEFELPSSIAESVARRERSLTPAALDLLQVFSVIGMTAPRRVARVVARSLDDVEFADAVDELIGNRLVTESQTGDEILMRHPLVQEAVYAGITGRRRSELHSLVARSLEELGEVTAPDDHARLAYHFGRGLDSDRPRAAVCSWRAGDSAVAIGAYEDAALFYQTAAERLIPRGDSAERCRLLVDLGRAQRKARDPEFRPTLLGAVEMARRLGDIDLQVTATLANDLQGILYVHIHSDPERIADLYDALHALEATGRGDSASTAYLLSQLAIELIWVNDYTARRDLLVRAIEAARSVGDRGALVAALSAVVVALRLPQCSELRRASYDELMELLATSTEGRLDPLVAVWIARAQIEYGELRAAVRTTTSLTAAQVSRDPELAWLARNIAFSIDLAAGRLERCESRLDTLRAIPSSPVEAYSFGRLLGPVFAFRTLRGDMAEVVAAREAITERFDIVDIYRACLATALVDVGETDAATELVDWYDRGRLEKIPLNNLWLSTIAPIGRVAAQVNNTEVCNVVYDLLLPYADENTISWSAIYGVVHHHLAELAIALGQFDSAARHLDDAFAAHSSRGFDGWYAETAYLAALLHTRRTGGPSDELVTRARRLADAAGATAVRRRIDALTAA